MRQKLISEGANELSYEIRGIVKKAEVLKRFDQKVIWENIGDPVQKHNQVPQWMREIIIDLLQENDTYGYCHSKGVAETRAYLAMMNNKLGGAQINADDILFFNGLGDAISKLYQYIIPTSRVIGPSPAYSTHSSAEAAHANHHPITYRLNPENNWYPDLEELYLKIKYNPNIVSILIINPDNPTGMVYPLEVLQKIVDIAREFDLFIVSDEIYTNITYNGTVAHPLSTIIGDVPGIAMKGISKELPWPGSRCGWVEYYNREKDPEFNRLCQTLDNAKMIEVCSTKLPQLAIPKIFDHPQYIAYRNEMNEKIGKRSNIITEILKPIKGLTFNQTFGAFYNTMIFKPEVLHQNQKLHIKNKALKTLVENEWIEQDMPNDKRFVYYLLAATGICTVPISSFASDLQGFRVTLLEEDEELLYKTFTTLRDAIQEYLTS